MSTSIEEAKRRAKSKPAKPVLTPTLDGADAIVKTARVRAPLAPDDGEGMSGPEMVELTKKHTLFEWSAQSKVDPIPVSHAKGIFFWTPEGKRFIDFNSQLMSVNIGHGDERVVRAISEQVAVLAYANPFMATEARARLGAKLAEITPGDIDTFFSPMRAPKRTKTPSRSRASLPDAIRLWPATAPITEQLQAPSASPAIRDAGPSSPECPA